MTKFKKGDKVMCVDADHSGEELTVGEKYTVKDCGQYLVDLVGILGSFNNERFILSEKSDELIADLQNQLDTWKRIHATDQECIRALMGKGFDLSQHVVLPVEEFRRMENRLLDESKYAKDLSVYVSTLLDEKETIAAEQRELVNIILRLRKPGNDLTYEESLKIMKILEEVK